MSPLLTRSMPKSASISFFSSPLHGSHPCRKSAKVPCDGCIQRASQDANGSNIQLCKNCTMLLRRPRRRIPQSANICKIRRYTDAVIDAIPGTPPEPVLIPWSGDCEVQHALQSFVHHRAPEFAGYFNSPFWQRMLLQCGRESPAIKHGIAAISALNERLLIGGDNNDAVSQRKTRFALEQCNQSIQHLTKPVDGVKPPGLRLMLTTCVLFTCFEAMQGHCEQAISHAKQGYALLEEYATDPKSDTHETGAFTVELDQLCLIMQRLQTQSKGLAAKNHITVGEDPGIDIPLPTYFDSLRDARNALEKAINHLSIYFLDLDLNDNLDDMICTNGDKFLVFGSWLKAWETAFTQLLARVQGLLTPTERKGAMVLKGESSYTATKARNAC
jgi:hypothetical protein